MKCALSFLIPKRLFVRTGFLVVVSNLSVMGMMYNSYAKKCIYVSSHHQSYDLEMEYDKGLIEKLGNACQMSRHYLNSKLNADPDAISKNAIRVKEAILAEKPDIVITSGQIATKEVLVKHFRDSSIPFVFSWLQDHPSKLGLPFPNTTGNYGVLHIFSMVQEYRTAKVPLKKVTQISEDSLNTRSNFKNLQQLFKPIEVEYVGVFSKSFEEWKKSFLEAQERSDAIIMLSHAGIPNWDRKKAIEFLKENMKIPVMSPTPGGMPYAAFGFVRSVAEQGEKSGDAAKEILGGVKPDAIPISKSERFDKFVNPAFIQKISLKLSDAFLKSAKTYKESP